MSESFNEQDFEALKKGNMQKLDKLYTDNYQYVMGILVHRRGASREDAQDILSEALLKFYSAVIRDKVSWGNVRAYLTRVALNLWSEQHKENSTYLQKKENALRFFYDAKEEEHFDKIIEREGLAETDKKLVALSQAWKSMDELCRQILEDMVVKNEKPRNLMEKYDYKNTRVITDKKIKCKQKLLKLTQEKLLHLS